MLRKIFLPLAKSHVELHTKWWHRFFVVIYVLLMVIFFLIALTVSSRNIPEKSFNLKIKNNLRDFSKNSSTSTINTVSDFVAQDGKFGCLQNNKINYYISTYDLKNKAVCSADIGSHIEETANKLKDIADDKSLSTEEFKKFVTNNLYKNDIKRYCFIRKSIDCDSAEIVNYHFSIYYYLQVVVYSLLVTYLFSLFLQTIYFKGFIYIIYGKK